MSLCTGLEVAYLIPRALARGWWISIGPSSFVVKLPLFVEMHMCLCIALGGLDYLIALNTTFSDGCLGSNNDEGRSEV